MASVKQLAPDRVAVLHPRLFRILLDIADKEGANPVRLCSGLGLARDDLDDPSMLVSPRQAKMMIQRAHAALPGTGMGIKIGGYATINSYGMVGMAMMSCDTLEEALRLGLEYSDRTDINMHASLKVHEKEGAIVFRVKCTDPVITPFLSEVSSACMSNLIGVVLREQVPLLRMEFSYPAPAYAADYKKLFQCPIQFNAPRTCMVLSKTWLESPIPTRDPLAKRQMAELLRREVWAADEHTFDLAKSIGNILRKNLRRRPSMAEVAASLHMSERTLRRHLAKNNLTFREILARVRSGLAIEMLQKTSKTDGEVAHDIGYSDPNNFRRAFKHWTGSAPSALKGRKKSKSPE